jgi:hypothetical protein
MPFIREDMADISVSIMNAAGTYVPYGDSWFSVEGGNLEADDAHTRAGGMGNDVSLGGPAARDDVTVAVQLSDVVIGWHKTLEQRVIESAPAKVSYTFLNRLKQPLGPPASSVTITGSCDERGS